ncbi:MAG: bifunctional UDP-N-acetylglucosamine diphosphorylase/glucosamine-1-phosphate N-acetyltransferase GlmU, partial [Oscillospiraceae bacterium]
TNDIVLGANDRKTLMQLNEIANNRNIEKHLSNGVEIIIKDGIIIGDDVTIVNGSIILPNTIIIKGSKIGKNCKIGPSSYIENSIISDNSKVIASYVCDYNGSENIDEDFLGPFDSVVEY